MGATMVFAMLFVVGLSYTSIGEAASRGSWQTEKTAQDTGLNAYTRNLLADDRPFTYSESGLKEWGGICQQGDTIGQSPIDIPKKVAKTASKNPMGSMMFNYRNFTGASAINKNGVQVNSPMGNKLTAGSTTWKLLQFHFHAPSEHKIGGKYADMEAHLVHQNMETEELAVVGVLLNVGKNKNKQQYNSALAQALAKVPPMVGKESGIFNLQPDTFTSLLEPAGGTSADGNVPAVTYPGSLTTPPCTAGVTWYVLVDASPVAREQELNFRRLLTDDGSLGSNARPVQPLLNRNVEAKF